MFSLKCGKINIFSQNLNSPTEKSKPGYLNIRFYNVEEGIKFEIENNSIEKRQRTEEMRKNGEIRIKEEPLVEAKQIIDEIFIKRRIHLSLQKQIDFEDLENFKERRQYRNFFYYRLEGI